jgi:D-glycero-D-manno-heptose 1,7-bisphosphate phosphatase
MGNRALFLDRDGVINIDHGYVFTIEKFEFVDGIFDLVKYAHDEGYLIIIITNQAGIGRGYYCENEFTELTRWMCEIFKNKESPITEVYFCPSHPDHGLGKYKVNDFRRKPHPGMIIEAARDYNIDLSSSVLIGDKSTDIEAGKSANVGCNILFQKNLGKTSNEGQTHVEISSLNLAKQFLKKVKR